jgi:hypothetical protein
MAGKAEAAVVEEQLLKLIVELNPMIRLQAKNIAAGKRLVNDRSIANTVAQSLSMDVDPLAAFDAAAEVDPRGEGFVSDAAVEKLLESIKPPASTINPKHRERLLRFLNRYEPYRLPQAAALLRQYEGHEHALFAALTAQYGPEPKLSDPDYFHEGTPALPAGWERVASETRGDVFYKNVNTGRRQWKRPFE